MQKERAYPSLYVAEDMDTRTPVKRRTCLILAVSMNIPMTTIIIMKGDITVPCGERSCWNEEIRNTENSICITHWEEDGEKKIVTLIRNWD